MLRKRSRPVLPDRSKGDLIPPVSSVPSNGSALRNKSSGFFRVPGLFVGSGIKVLPDPDSARSPTSPLDLKGFAPNGPQKSWHCSRVGLGIVDSLNDETKPSERFLGFSETRGILFGSQVKINIPSKGNKLQDILNSPASPKSLPKNYAMSLHIQMKSSLPQSGSSESTHLISCTSRSNCDNFCSDVEETQMGYPHFFNRGSDSGNFSGAPSSLPASMSCSRSLMSFLSASEIELSEDYTRVICHGPNPKTTHIFGDCILESHSSGLGDGGNPGWGIGSPCSANCLEDPAVPSDDFLNSCFHCKKKLEEGKDIYIYRGEKAFCSSSCRMQEILEEEKTAQASDGFLPQEKGVFSFDCMNRE